MQICQPSTACSLLQRPVLRLSAYPPQSLGQMSLHPPGPVLQCNTWTPSKVSAFGTGTNHDAHTLDTQGCGDKRSTKQADFRQSSSGVRAAQFAEIKCLVGYMVPRKASYMRAPIIMSPNADRRDASNAHRRDASRRRPRRQNPPLLQEELARSVQCNTGEGPSVPRP